MISGEEGLELEMEWSTRGGPTRHRVLILVDEIFIKVLYDQFFGLFRHVGVNKRSKAGSLN